MAATAEAWQDGTSVALFPAEWHAIKRAVPKRQREFTTARGCARQALDALGVPPVPIVPGEAGEPLWPTGIVGSITHCEGYCGCAVARSSDLVGLGIDAEPNAPLPAGILSDIACDHELSWIQEAALQHPSIHWDRMLFSAKEAAYKVWYPLMRQWLGFRDAAVTIDPQTRQFDVRLLLPGQTRGEPAAGFRGRWSVENDLILTAIALPPDTT